jgi:hypothetical protein
MVRRRFLVSALITAATILAIPSEGQAPANPAAPAKGGAPAEAPPSRVEANLLQLMRGILYPASNVIFAAQNDNPADLKPAPGKDPSLSTDPLLSTYGGWQAVETLRSPSLKLPTCC